MVTSNRDLNQGQLLEPPTSPERLSRTQLVDRILQLNHTATPEFLSEFSEDSLSHYLAHLTVMEEPSVPWVRRGLAPAIVRREAGE